MKKRPSALRKISATSIESVLLKDGLPAEAYAITGPDPAFWQLPHHSKFVITPGKGIEQTVDWLLVDTCVLLLSRQGIDGRRVAADPGAIIAAARHIAAHYRHVGRHIPIILAALITDEI